MSGFCFWLETWEHHQWEAAGVWLTAFATIGLWAFTWRLWSATVEAAKALPLIERAYVYIDVTWRPSVTQISSTAGVQSGTVFLRYTLTNHGKTPARLVRVGFWPLVQSTTPNEYGNTLQTEQLGTVLGPGQSTPPLQFELAVDIEGYKKIIGPSPRLNLYVAGEYQFTDILGDLREETFCFEQVSNRVDLSHFSQLNRFRGQ